MTITLRNTKGSALTYEEMDGNFSGLADLSLTTFTQSGTGAVATDLQTKNRQIVSVFDFMTAAQIADVIARTTTLDVTTAIQNALNASLFVTFPAGTYKITSSLVTQLDQTIWGAGMQQTVIVPTGAGVHGFTEPSSGSYTRCRISDLSISGGSTTGSGIYVPTKLAYTCVFRNILISMGGNAVHMPTEFSTLYENVFVSSSTGHGFFVNGGNTTTFINCYASTISTAGKFGYRCYAGGAFISCNGVDSGSNWGMFGSTVAIDGVNTIFNCVFIRCNVEAFTDIGIRFIYQGNVKFDGGTFTVVSGNYTTCISVETSTSTTRIDGTQFFTSGATPSKLADVFTSGSNYDLLTSGATNLAGIDENGTLRSLPTVTGGYVAWTPVLEGTSTPGTNTYTTQAGQYRVDGQMVTAWFRIDLSGNSVAMVGSLQISGLPFVAYNSLSYPGTGYCSEWNNVTLFSASYTHIGLTVAGNTSIISIKQSGTNVAAGSVSVASINGTTGQIRGCVQYIKK